MGQLDRAIPLLEHAVKLQPLSAEARDKLGSAWFQKGWIGPAIDSFREALRLKRDFVVAHDHLIKALLASAYYHEAIDACHDAFAVAPATADLHCQLAVALEQTHQLDEALAAVKEALSIEPAHVRANFVMARLEKRSGDLVGARDRLNRTLQKNLPPVQAASLADELGDVLDRMGDYAAAYRAFETGNNVLARTVTPAQAAQEPIFEKISGLKQWFSEGDTGGWGNTLPNDDKSPPVFLVGFPRSGTTLTEQLIASLEQFIPSDEKPMLDRLVHELPELIRRSFRYPEDLDTLSVPELVMLRKRYWELAERMVGPIKDGKRLLDKMPFNIVDLGMVYRLFPDAKVIIVLRDARDACLSCFMQPFMPSQTNIHLMSLENSARLYAAVMELWLHYRSTLQLSFIEVRYEDLVADFETVARRVIEFIGAPWDDAVLHYFEHARTRNVSTPSYSAVASPIYSRSIGRWEHYKAHFEPLMETLDPYLKEFGYK
jgi:hypothetical protein